MMSSPVYGNSVSTPIIDSKFYRTVELHIALISTYVAESHLRRALRHTPSPAFPLQSSSRVVPQWKDPCARITTVEILIGRKSSPFFCNRSFNPSVLPCNIVVGIDNHYFCLDIQMLQIRREILAWLFKRQQPFSRQGWEASDCGSNLNHKIKPLLRSLLYNNYEAFRRPFTSCFVDENSRVASCLQIADRSAHSRLVYQL